MSQQKEELINRYKEMSTDELVDIYRKGTLTDQAYEAMRQVLAERNVSSEEINVVTEELVELEKPRLASRRHRFFAQFLDNLIAIGIVGLLYLLLAPFTKSFTIVLVIAYLAYYLFCDGLPRGQSIGKTAFGISVVNTKNGRPCGFGRSLIRNISLLVLGILDVVFILGKNKRRFGDYAADTEVINLVQKNVTVNL